MKNFDNEKKPKKIIGGFYLTLIDSNVLLFIKLYMLITIYLLCIENSYALYKFIHGLCETYFVFVDFCN